MYKFNLTTNQITLPRRIYLKNKGKSFIIFEEDEKIILKPNEDKFLAARGILKAMNFNSDSLMKLKHEDIVE